jgi:UDP-3-O-[3-hydroxymyristoyl] N-acetylglucosamine deacetylase
MFGLVGTNKRTARIMNSNSLGGRQTTLDEEVVLTGIGVHSAAPVTVVLHPAEANSGLTFYVANGEGGPAVLHADFRSVTNVTLCTVLGNADGAMVATVEHLLAALRGMGVDNADVEVDGSEAPIMDGSAEPFVEAIREAGVRELDEPRRFIRILKPVRVEEGAAYAEFTPYDGFRIDVEIDFPTPLVGRQRVAMDLTPANFRRELSRARTFGFMKDVKQLWATGRALGASLDNTVVLGDDRVINPEGLRYADEFVRHKALDAVGDLALAGAPLLGAFRSYRGGHKLNNMVLHALYKDQDSWAVVEASRGRGRQTYQGAGRSIGGGLWGQTIAASADRS